MTISAIVCAHNESRLLPACLFSLLSQTRSPDEILVVDGASTDGTGTVARTIPRVRVISEPRKGLNVPREAVRQAVSSDILAYIDADYRAPLQWLGRVERRFQTLDGLATVTGPYRFYDWDPAGSNFMERTRTSAGGSRRTDSSRSARTAGSGRRRAGTVHGQAPGVRTVCTQFVVGDPPSWSGRRRTW